MQGSQRNKATLILAAIAGALLVLSLASQCAEAQNTCIVTGTVLDGSSQPVQNASVRFRVISPTLVGISGIAVQDLTTKTAANGTWTLTVIEGLNAQIDILAIGVQKDTTLPNCSNPNPGTITFASLTLFNRGTLTPATILSNVGPTLGGDLLGSSPNPQVVGFRGKQLVSGTPTNGQGYFYDSGQGKFTLQSVAAVLGGAVVSSITGGTGITISGSSSVPIVGITAGGVTATELSAGENTLINGAVQKAGSVMTGLLTLSGDSSVALNPTTKQEVTAALALKLNSNGVIPESQVTNLVADLAATEKTANKGAANGYAPLNGSSIVPNANLPATFTPALHASTHATGGTDPITPASITAANLVHTHAESDVVNLVTDLAGKAGTSSANTFSLLQTFNGGISVPGGFSPGGAFTIQPTFSLQIQMAAPGAPGLTPSASGGSLASATYFYVLTSLDGTGETVKGAESSTPVTGPNGSVALAWTAIPGATYRVYRGTSAGAENTYYAAGTNSFTDTGAAGTGGTPPVSTTAFADKFSPIGSSWVMGGSLGIGKSTPATALDVNGTATAVAFAGPLTGNVTGNVTGNLTGNVTGNVTGSAGSISGILATANGGLGINAGASTGFPKFTAGAVAIANLVAGDIPILDASKITTGQLALARGGTNADLSATGGASQFLRQNSVGGAITVIQPAYTDLTGTPSALPPNGAASGDLAGSYPSPTTAKLNTATVPAAGALTTGNVLQVTGVSALSYAPVNLAGGVNFVTGALPAANVGALPASQITSGQLALARGGTNTDLSATGGANQIVRQNSVGGNFTVSVLASGDMPATIASNTSGSAASFTGSLVGDVTGTQGATVVSTVAASTAANVHAAELAANAATATNTVSTIMKRDGAGQVAATTFTGALAGNATTASDGLTSAAGTAPLTLSLAAKALTGSVAVFTGATAGVNGSTGIVPQPLLGQQNFCLLGNSTWAACSNGSVSSVGLSMPADFGVANTPVTSSGTLTVTRNSQAAHLFLGAPFGGAGVPGYRLLDPSDIPTPLTSNTSGTSSGFTGNLAGDVTGPQGTTVVALVGGSTAANVNTATVAVNTNATASATPSTLVKRDGSAGFAANIITSTQDIITNAGATIDLVNAQSLAPARFHLADSTAVTGGGFRLSQTGLTTSLNEYSVADALLGTAATFTSTGTTTPLTDKGGQVFNVKAYGAKGDGVTDDTAAINAARTASVTGGVGSVVYFPQGNYIVTGATGLSGFTTGQVLQGAGSTSSTITNTTNGSTTIVADANGISINNLSIKNTGTGSTTALAVSNTTSRYENLVISGVVTGISSTGSSNLFRYVSIGSPGAAAAGLTLNGGTDNLITGLTITGATYVTGLKDTGGGARNTYEQLNINVAATDAAMRSGTSDIVMDQSIITNQTITVGTFGLISTGSGPVINNSIITGGFVGMSISGGARFASIENTTVKGAGGQGIGTSSGGVRLVNCTSTGHGLSASNTYAALLIDGTSFTVIGGQYGDTSTTKYGIQVQPTATAFYVDDVYTQGLTAGTSGLVLAAAIPSAASIGPQSAVVHVSGTAVISTIGVPAGVGSVTLIPDGLWTMNTAGNIGATYSATVGIPVRMVYDDTLLKWYPQGSNVPSMTAGSIPFADTNGVLTQDNANLFWDKTNKRLGIGTATPTQVVDVTQTVAGLIVPRFQNLSNNNTAGVLLQFLNDTGQLGAFRVNSSTFAATQFGLAGASLVSSTANNGSAGYVHGTVGTGSDYTATNSVVRQTIDTSGNATLSTAGASYTSPTQTITASSNGATMVSSSLTELITLSTVAATTDSVANLLPANSIIDAVTCFVTTNITVAANWSLGDATTAARFSVAAANQTAGSTVVGLAAMFGVVTTTAAGPTQAAAAKLRITSNVTPGAGAIRCTSFFRTFNPPTS